MFLVISSSADAAHEMIDVVCVTSTYIALVMAVVIAVKIMSNHRQHPPSPSQPEVRHAGHQHIQKFSVSATWGSRDQI